jgi:hypothetical protein
VALWSVFLDERSDSGCFGFDSGLETPYSGVADSFNPSIEYRLNLPTRKEGINIHKPGLPKFGKTF